MEGASNSGKCEGFSADDYWLTKEGKYQSKPWKFYGIYRPSGWSSRVIDVCDL